MIGLGVTLVLLSAALPPVAAAEVHDSSSPTDLQLLSFDDQLALRNQLHERSTPGGGADAHIGPASISAAQASTGFAITQESDPDELGNVLAGAGVTIDYAGSSGDHAQFGTFADGTEAIGFSEGIVLSTGRVTDLVGVPNEFASTGFGRGGNSRATDLAGAPTHDAAILSLTVIPDRATLQIDLAFGSEEYPDFVNSAFNDVTAVFVNGTNCATLPDGSPIAINNVNHLTNSHLFRSSPGDGVVLGGMTVPRTCTAPVRPGIRNRVEIVIADASDNVYDSAVFLRASSVRSDGPTGVTRAPRPLYGAHGFTGQATDMDPSLAMARAFIPDLRADDTSALDNGKTEGVWGNSTMIIAEAERLGRGRQDPRINVIAHSKGGLDSRAAMWERPELFASLGMLATPNGGSFLADIACGVVNAPTAGLPVGVIGLPGMGDCGVGTALHNLTTPYSIYFNIRVRDKTEHDLGVAAGACGGILCLAINKILCGNAGFLGLGAQPGDKSVCVASAFARTTLGGRHDRLGTFSADHTQMRQLPCPIARTLAFVYGSANVGNPYVDGDGSGCASLRISSAINPGSAVSTLSASPTPHAIDEELLAMRDMLLVVAEADETIVPLDLGADQLQHVLVFAPAGSLIAGELVAGGEVVGALEQVFEAGAYFADADDALPAPTSLHLTAPPGTGIGIVTLVKGTFPLAAQATSTRPGLAQVSVWLEDLAPGTVVVGEVVTVMGVEGPPHREPFEALVADDGTAAEIIEMPAPVGQAALYSVQLTAPAPRVAVIGTVGEPAGGAIGELVSEQLVDTNSDEVPDVLRLGVEFQADEPGVYELGLELTNADGDLITTTNGRTAYGSGTSIIEVDVPVALLLTGGDVGPYELREGLLVHVGDDRMVARRDFMGRTNLTDPTSLAVPGTLLGPASVSIVASPGGSTIVFETAAVVLDDRDYIVDGIIWLADGRSLRVSTPVGGSPGRHVARFTVSPLALHGSGPGYYSIGGLQIREADDTFALADAPGASIHLDQVAVPTELVATPIIVSVRPNERFHGVAARLTDAGGLPLEGRVIRFATTEGLLCESVTDDDGRADCSAVPGTFAKAVSAGRYEATFDGDGAYLGSSDVGVRVGNSGKSPR